MQFNHYTIIIGMICGAILFYKLPVLTKKKAKNIKNDIKISVVIPARNEEINLPNILSDLKMQTFHIHEVICVDDNSEDRTPEIIKEFDIKGVNVSKLPSNWKGKPWACQCGAKSATGDTMLFIDADVRLSNTAIESLVSRFIKNKTPISVQPYHTVKKQHEHFSLFYNLVEICSTAMSFLNAKNTYGFFGPVLMISKELFDKHGGYDTVKNTAIEDFSLGNYYNKNGIKINLFCGSDEISFRMYPDSFSSVFEAWTRNFSSGSVSTKSWILFMVVFWIACLTAIPIEIFQSISAGNSLALIIMSVAYFANALFVYKNAKAIGSYPFYVCLLYPIYLVAFHIIFICSVFGTFLFQCTTWKGRKL